MKLWILAGACALLVISCAFAVVTLIESNRLTRDSGSSPAAATVSARNSSGSSRTDPSSSAPGDKSSGSSSSSASGAPSGSSEAVGYTVRTYGNSIAIFKDGSSTPEQVADKNPATLPESERERLSVGIHVDTYDNAVAILEDYTS